MKKNNEPTKLYLYVFLTFMLFGINSCGPKSIKENDIINIALEYNLEEGIDSLKVKLLWDDNYQKKVWIVLSTLAASQAATGYSAVGKGLIIDSESGKILKENYWYVK